MRSVLEFSRFPPSPPPQAGRYPMQIGLGSLGPVAQINGPDDDGWTDEGYSTGRPRPIETRPNQFRASTTTTNNDTMIVFGAAGFGAGLLVAGGILLLRKHSRRRAAASSAPTRRRVGRVSVELGQKRAQPAAVDESSSGSVSHQLESA